jgi:uncharacterized protein YbjT (DUF2867 family)
MEADGTIGCVTVFGGSGVLGREIVEQLVAEGIAVRIAVRHVVTDSTKEDLD